MKTDAGLITISEVARILHCAEDTARRLADRGVLEAARLSTGVRVFSRVDVERVAETRRAERAGR